MTYEKAISILNEIGGYCSNDAKYVACDIAIEALEKQIPDKPLWGYTCKANNTSWRSCPVCHARQHNTHKFCSQCGQALDWSDDK